MFSPFEFYVTLRRHHLALERLMDELNSREWSTAVECAVVGGHYLAHYEGEWCRVRAEAVTGKGTTQTVDLFYIDFGTKQQVCLVNLRFY